MSGSSEDSLSALGWEGRRWLLLALLLLASVLVVRALCLRFLFLPLLVWPVPLLLNATVLVARVEIRLEAEDVDGDTVHCARELDAAACGVGCTWCGCSCCC